MITAAFRAAEEAWLEPPDPPPTVACVLCGGDGCKDCDWTGEVEVEPDEPLDSE